MGATLYKLITGITPLSASLLASGEKLKSPPLWISLSTKKAIAAAMKINKAKRPQSMDEFLELLKDPKVKEEDETTVLSSAITSQAVLEKAPTAPAPAPVPEPEPVP